MEADVRLLSDPSGSAAQLQLFQFRGRGSADTACARMNLGVGTDVAELVERWLAHGTHDWREC